MRVLIGYDGSECAAAAIEGLAGAGLPERAEAVVLSVADLLVESPYAGLGTAGEVPATYPPEAVEAARRLAHQAMQEAKRAAAQGANQVAAVFPGWTVRDESVADSPYWALVRRAEEWPADLVVVGSHGRSTLGRLILGSVSQNVLNHAPCTVRIGRRGAGKEKAGGVSRPGGLRILLAVDGSPDSKAAVRAVAARNWPAGTEVRAVTALDPRTSTALIWSGAWAEHAEYTPGGPTLARRWVEAAARALREDGLAVAPVVLEGDPKWTLAVEAERWGADCIFLGAKGHSRLERFLLGSVSAAVAARAPCSVEVVRPR
jgi:nucleotide-binding universal stress UspA family protein